MVAKVVAAGANRRTVELALRHVWRGGADDKHEGVGDPFDRHNTFIDRCLELHRSTEMPASAFVTDGSTNTSHAW